MDWNEVTSAIKATKYSKAEPSELEKAFDDFSDMQLALAEWYKSQDIPPQKAAVLMAAFAGALVGIRADSINDAFEGFSSCAGILQSSAAIQVKRRQENGEKIV
jgi:hypothetical protein